MISGIGAATVAADGMVLDTWYPSPQSGALSDNRDAHEAARALVVEAVGADDTRGVSIEQVEVEIDLDAAPSDTPDAYLRLHALSHRLVAPNDLNLDGIFGALPNVAWTNAGPVDPRGLDQRRPRLQRAGIQVQGLDKFPRLTDYVVPAGVRIADASRVRLGAYLSPGTTVMHEGFVNFNAGTLGTSMIEGRISQGVIVEDGSDVGGGASTMGTLSGGGTQRVRIGKRSLVGAEAGIGIALGDDCVVEAGLYVTAGTKVVVVGERGDGAEPHTVKARDLSGVPNLLFRRNSLSGAVEVVAREGQTVALNDALHAN